MSSNVRFALTLVAGIVLLTLAAGAYVFSEPVSLGISLARSGLKRAGLQESTVDGPRGPQAYFRGGSGPKVMVLVHGLGQQAGGWLKVVSDLGQEYRLLVPDLAGHGDSAPGSGGALTLGMTVEGLEAVLAEATSDASGGRVPVTLVGSSFGGWVAARYALEHPERVDRLILVDSQGLKGHMGGGPAGDAAAGEPLTLLPENRHQARRLVRALGPDDALEPAGFVLDDLIEEIRAGPSARLLSSLKEDDYLDLRLAELDLPVDVIWGLEDGLLPPAMGRRLVEELPRARFHGLEGCGHVPQQQCPRAFIELLLAILESDIPSAGGSDPVPEAAMGIGGH